MTPRSSCTSRAAARCNVLYTVSQHVVLRCSMLLLWSSCTSQATACFPFPFPRVSCSCASRTCIVRRGRRRAGASGRHQLCTTDAKSGAAAQHGLEGSEVEPRKGLKPQRLKEAQPHEAADTGLANALAVRDIERACLQQLRLAVCACHSCTRTHATHAPRTHNHRHARRTITGTRACARAIRRTNKDTQTKTQARTHALTHARMHARTDTCAATIETAVPTSRLARASAIRITLERMPRRCCGGKAQVWLWERRPGGGRMGEGVTVRGMCRTALSSSTVHFARSISRSGSAWCTTPALAPPCFGAPASPPKPDLSWAAQPCPGSVRTS